MAVVSAQLFFMNNRSYQAGSILLDLILQEDHSMTSSVTNYNVEDGSVISDHIYNGLETGSLTGFISNFSIKQGAIVTNRAQDTFDLLTAMWEAREPVIISTVLKIYENVVITDIKVSRDENTGEAIEFAISFQKIRTVKLHEVTIEANIKLNSLDSDKQKQASVKKKLSKQQAVF